MKKLYTSVAALLLCAATITPAAAQNDPNSVSTGANTLGFRGGLKILGGPGFFSVDAEQPNEYSIRNDGARMTFAYGAFMDYYFASHYGVGLELRQLFTGGNFIYTPNNSVPDTAYNRRIRLQYIELPITLKFRTNEVNYIRFYAQAGFNPGINVKAKGDITSYYAGKMMLKGEKVSNEIRKFNLGVNIGLGTEYNIGGTTSLVTGINWNNGLTNVWAQKSKGRAAKGIGKDEELLNTKLQHITLNVGVVF